MKHRWSRWARRAAGLGSLVAGMLCLAATACMITTAPAMAAVVQFGGEGEGAGEFAAPTGIAVDNGSLLEGPSAGDVYVVDRGNSRVDKFSGEGEFLLAWGWGVADGKAEAEMCGPAAATPTLACRQGIPGGASAQFEAAGGVAVDDSSSLSHGDVYVEDNGNHRIEKFTEDGEFLLAWGAGVADGKAEPETCGPEAAGSVTCQAGLAGAGPGEFESLGPNTVGVDSLGEVYVGSNGGVQKFGAGGQFEERVTFAGAGAEINALAVAPDNSIYALSSEFGSPVTGVRRYDSSGAEVGTPRDPAAEFSSLITLGRSGELFVKDESAQIAEFEAEGDEVATFPNGEGASGIAFGEERDALYVLTGSEIHVVALPPPGPLVENEEATAEPAGTATLRATINPEGRQTKYRFEYGLVASSETATETKTMTAEEFEAETVEVKLTGLLPEATYHFRVVVENSAGTPPPEDATFTTLPAVSIDSESVSQVSSSSARLAATLNPLGLPSEYHFEYGPTTGYGSNVPVPEGKAGSGVGDVQVSLLLEALEPGTTYHYRVVAHNTFGETKGPDRSFTTQAGESRGLIDGRGWELVSPPDKHGSALEAITPEGGVIQAAADGDGLAYIARAPLDAEPAGNRSFAEEQNLATRQASGWSSQDIATAHEAVAGLGRGLSEYRLFSPNLSTGVVEPTGATPLSPQASERTPYSRDASGGFVPLVNPANVPAGTKFGADEEGGKLEPGTGVEFAAAAPDLAHILLSAPQSLTAGFETGGQRALYEWFGETLQPVSILPGGLSAATEGGVVSTGEGHQLARGAISSDGNRVFFQSVSERLFMRDMEQGESVWLDGPEEGARGSRGGSGEVASYQDASSSGEQVLFEDAARLTVGATANEGEPDLYMCETVTSVDERSCAAKGDLKDLTIDANPGEAADVLGAVIGSSEDGSYVYFVANGVLSNHGTAVAGATHGDCGEPSGSLPTATLSCNLYMSHNGVITLVAVLSNRDFPDWEAGAPPHSDLSALTARVSPNGRFLAFMSQRSLTGFDNRDATSGVPDEEVFMYDASSGRTVCASCNPSSARPAGVLDPKFGSNELPVLVDRPHVWAEQWLAGSIPGWTAAQVHVAWYQSRYLSNEGRLFFNSSVGLVPKDTNGQQDVYEFEPEGLGGCTSATLQGSVMFVKEVAGSPVGGCVGLISSGTSSEESAFLDASAMGPGGEEGEDVFFLAATKLAPQDVDRVLDAYDAHVCSTAAPCPSRAVTTSPACSTAESCEASAALQPAIAGAPGTATMSGTGNVVQLPSKPKTLAQQRAEKLAKALKLCRRDKSRKKRARCEASARKKYGAKAKAKTKSRKKRKRS